jgi:hypothetical protein
LFVFRAYADLLGRAPDGSGLTQWTHLLDQGISRGDVALALLRSDEYRGLLARYLYQNWLGRSPSAGEVQGWLGAMRQGTSAEQVLTTVLASTEYFNRTAVRDAGDWIDAMYASMLGRNADLAGKNAALQALSQGTSRATVASWVVQSVEREQRVMRTNYERYLDRDPGTSELNGWVNVFLHGTSNEQIVAGIIGSDEYLQRAKRV